LPEVAVGAESDVRLLHVLLQRLKDARETGMVKLLSKTKIGVGLGVLKKSW
jgi:hypothetical protein